MTTAGVANKNAATSPGWLAVFRGQGYFFRQAAILTLLIGVYAHVTRAFIGDELLLRYVVTQTFDQVLVLPMAYTAIAGVLGWRLIDFRGTGQRLVQGFMLFYVIGSLPVHVRSYFDESSTQLLKMFPMWWTYVLFILLPALMVHCWRLRYKRK
jgi:hypothetical protein